MTGNQGVTTRQSHVQRSEYRIKAFSQEPKGYWQTYVIRDNLKPRSPNSEEAADINYLHFHLPPSCDQIQDFLKPKQWLQEVSPPYPVWQYLQQLQLFYETMRAKCYLFLVPICFLLQMQLWFSALKAQPLPLLKVQRSFGVSLLST